MIKSKTTFIIAHRITSIQDCDRIIVLDKGNIIEEGTHDELFVNNGFYRKIYDIQVSIEEEIKRESESELKFKLKDFTTKTQVTKSYTFFIFFFICSKYS